MGESLLPDDEEARLASLQSYRLLDTLLEENFDELTRLASEICGAPMALVTLVDKDRGFFKSRQGLTLQEAPRDVTFCAHTLLADDELIVGDMLCDDRFCNNPFVLQEPKIRFYAGVPLRGREGLKLGTLCVLDREPRALTPFQLSALKTLRRQVEAQFELRRSIIDLASTRLQLQTQRDALARLQAQKEELTALAAHDLKNPVASMLSNARFVLREKGLSADAREALEDILTSGTTLQERILHLLEASKSEGPELKLSRTEFRVADLLRDTARDLGRLAQERTQSVRVGACDEPRVLCADLPMIRRVLENLVTNALQYSPPRTEVLLEAEDRGAFVELRVSDRGVGVPPADRERIFESGVRLGAGEPGEAHQGLGLSFCRRAVMAHDGKIWVEARAGGGSLFRVLLPSAVPAPS